MPPSRKDDRLERLISSIERTLERVQGLARDHGPENVANQIDLDVAINTADNLSVAVGAGTTTSGQRPPAQAPPVEPESYEPQE